MCNVHFGEREIVAISSLVRMHKPTKLGRSLAPRTLATFAQCFHYIGDPIISLQTPKSKYTNGRANRKAHLARVTFISGAATCEWVRVWLQYLHKLAIDVETKWNHIFWVKKGRNRNDVCVFSEQCKRVQLGWAAKFYQSRHKRKTMHILNTVAIFECYCYCCHCWYCDCKLEMYSSKCSKCTEMVLCGI